MDAAATGSLARASREKLFFSILFGPDEDGFDAEHSEISPSRWPFLEDGEPGRGKVRASVQRPLALTLARRFALVSATPLRAGAADYQSLSDARRASSLMIFSFSQATSSPTIT